MTKLLELLDQIQRSIDSAEARDIIISLLVQTIWEEKTKTTK